MAKDDSQSWRLNRVVNLSVLMQLVFLGSLIIGSWVNLQSQLNLLGRDVRLLVQSNKEFQQKLENLWASGIEREYRLRAVEEAFTKMDKNK